MNKTWQSKRLGEYFPNNQAYAILIIGQVCVTWQPKLSSLQKLSYLESFEYFWQCTNSVSYLKKLSFQYNENSKKMFPCRHCEVKYNRGITDDA